MIWNFKAAPDSSNKNTMQALSDAFYSFSYMTLFTSKRVGFPKIHLNVIFTFQINDLCFSSFLLISPAGFIAIITVSLIYRFPLWNQITLIWSRSFKYFFWKKIVNFEFIRQKVEAGFYSFCSAKWRRHLPSPLRPNNQVEIHGKFQVFLSFKLELHN